MTNDKSHITDPVRADLAKLDPDKRRRILEVADADRRGQGALSSNDNQKRKGA